MTYNTQHTSVIPAKAGIQSEKSELVWIHAFARMTIQREELNWGR